MTRHPHIALVATLGAAFGLALSGCNQQEQQDIPNRVLDRPTDVALVCAEVLCIEDEDGNESCTTQPVPLSVCETETGSCASDNPHLVGFVANSERNEIAMFTKCSNRLVDMDVSSPGYDFIPAGLLPTELDASEDGCRVVSANVGSCDLTVLDAPGLARYGLGSADELGRTDQVDEPSSLVATLIPVTFDAATNDYRPLGARPGQLALVPAQLTQAPGLGPGQTLEGVCDPLVRRSVYVTFPTCNLVAEVDMQTGRVLQSRQFVSDGAGGVDVVDTGVSPSCPIECPVQFQDTELPEPQDIDDEGPFIQALTLALPPTPPTDVDTVVRYDEADELIEGQRLFLGGFGSDIVFELPISDSGVWAPSVNQLELRNAGGIKNIDVSPATHAPVGASPFGQFLYIVAGDGSTRVVGRELPTAPDSVGVECETQADPIVLTQGTEVSACVPVSQSPNEDQPPERRGFSRGPGIRPGGGQEVTDWLFRKSYEGEGAAGPFREPSTAAVGVTTGGFAIYSMIDQERASGETNVEDLYNPPAFDPDPAGIMDVRLFAHSLWPEPTENGASQLPLVLDSSPTRTIPASASDPIRTLAPTLRRIDAAYVNEPDAFAKLNVIGDLDNLGQVPTADEFEQLYEEPVVRAVVHDYRSWAPTTGPSWTLEWEGTINNTSSSTGRIECDSPGWPAGTGDWRGGTCTGGTRLIDDGADFCEDGVLRGDKLVIIGCVDDDDCGDGRRCLRESVAGGDSTGICISAQAYSEHASDLREVCGPFISDPCGEASREFLITRATPTVLELEALEQPFLSHTVALDEEPVDGFAPVVAVEDQYVCTDWQVDGGCEVDDDCKCDPTSEADAENGCDELAADGVCVEGRCRRPCADGEDCVYRRLPGPDCFGEFVRYQVALRNAFRVSGPQPYEFITDRVEAVDLGNGEFECSETANADLSQLLTSRLPLPRSDDPDDPEWLAIPACPDDLVLPNDPNPCRIVSPRALENTFHVFEYEGATVSALRFSNPVFSIVIDLTALEGLTSEVEGFDDLSWPIDFTSFRRSRIPRGYRTGFGLGRGYRPFGDSLDLEGRPITYPIRIVAAPQPGVAFIVDGSGPGSSSSIRGQVVRVTLGDLIVSDEAFIGVR